MELVNYYQTKYQSVPVIYPGSAAIESMFVELDREGVDLKMIRKIIIAAIDRKFDSYNAYGGFMATLSMGELGNSAILLAQNRIRNLRNICKMATNKAIIRKK